MESHRADRLLLRSVPEIHKDAAEIPAVVLHPVKSSAYVRLLQEALHLLFELAAAFSGNDLQFADSFFKRLQESLLQRPVYGAAVVVDVVEIKFDAGHG